MAWVFDLALVARVPRLTDVPQKTACDPPAAVRAIRKRGGGRIYVLDEDNRLAACWIHWKRGAGYRLTEWVLEWRLVQTPIARLGWFDGLLTG